MKKFGHPDRNMVGSDGQTGSRQTYILTRYANLDGVPNNPNAELNMQTIIFFKELYTHIKIEKRLLRIVLLSLLISTFFWMLDVTGPYWLFHRTAVRHIPFIGAYKLPLESALRNGILLILYISLAASLLLWVAFLREFNACLIRMKINKIETFKYQLAALLVAYVVIFLVALPKLFALMLLKPFGFALV